MNKFFCLFISFTFAVCVYSEDITLSKAVRFGLDNSLDIKAAHNRLKQYLARKDLARSYLFPKLSLGYSKTYLGDHPYLTYEKTKDWWIEAEQVLFDSGKYIFNLSANKELYLSQKSELGHLKKNLIYNIRVAFLSCLLYKEKLSVLKEQKKIMQEHLSSVEERFKYGEVPKLDVLRAKSYLEELNPLISNAEKEYILALDNLKILIGKNLEDDLEVKGKLIKEEIQDLGLDVLMSKVIKDREDLASLNYKLGAQKFFYRSSFSGYLPQVSLQFKDTFGEHAAFSTERKPYDDYWSLILTFKLNVFDGLSVASQISEAKYKLEELEKLVSKLEQKIRLEVKEVWLDLKRIERDLISKEENLKLTQATLNTARKRFLNGEVSQLDFLEAEVKFREARLSYLTAIFSQQEILARLDYILAKPVEQILNSMEAKDEKNI
jgi:outer membrane protein TolC